MSENEPCTFTLDEMLQSDDDVYINVALSKGIRRIVEDWLTQFLKQRTRESERSEGAYLQLEELIRDVQDKNKEQVEK